MLSGVMYPKNVHSPPSCRDDEAMQSQSCMSTSKNNTRLPSPQLGSEPAAFLMSPIKKGMKESACVSFEEIDMGTRENKISALVLYEDLISRNSVASEECSMISPCGNTEDEEPSPRRNFVIEKTFKHESFVPYKEELPKATLEEGGNCKNKNDSLSSGLICNPVGVLRTTDNPYEKTLSEKGFMAAVSLRPRLPQTEWPHPAPRRRMSVMCGTPRPPPGNSTPTKQRRKTFLVSETMDSKPSDVFVNEAKTCMNEDEGKESSVETVNAVDNSSECSKFVVSTVPIYLFEDVNTGSMDKLAVQEEKEDDQHLDSAYAESMHESSLLGSHSYYSNNRGASDSESRTMSDSSSCCTRSTCSLNTVSTAMVLPLKVGCVEAPPFRAFVDLHYRFTFRNLLDPYAEPAVIYEWSTLGGRWNAVQTSVVVFPTPFAHGNTRASYYVIDLNCLSCRMVGKRYLRPSVEEKQYFDDVSMRSIANHWARRFNRCKPPKAVRFLPSAVMELTGRLSPMIFAMEPQLTGEFIKYKNTNDCVPREIHWTPQAFSHFTYHTSEGKLMIVDLQDVEDLYTDPRILTLDGEGYGRGNLGRKGMHHFLRTHQCNEVCSILGLPRMLHGRGGETLHAGYPHPPRVHLQADLLEILPPKSHDARSPTTLEIYKWRMPHSPHMCLTPEPELLPRSVGHLQNTPTVGRLGRTRGNGSGVMKRIRLLLSRRIFSWNYNEYQTVSVEQDCEANIWSHALR